MCSSDLLGGCWFPIQVAELPTWATVVTHATLTHWAMSAFQGMFWHQKAWSDPVLLRAIGVQWAFVLAGAFAAARIWKWRYLAK